MQHSRTIRRLTLLSRIGLHPVEHQEHQRHRGHAMRVLRRDPGRPQPDQLWHSDAAPDCVATASPHNRKALHARAPAAPAQRVRKLGPPLMGRCQQLKLNSKTAKRRTVSPAQATGMVVILCRHPAPAMGQAAAVLGTVAKGLSTINRPNVLHVWSSDSHN